MTQSRCTSPPRSLRFRKPSGAGVGPRAGASISQRTSNAPNDTLPGIRSRTGTGAVDSGSRNRGRDGVAEQRRALGIVERPLVGLADRGARRRNDYCISHVLLSVLFGWDMRIRSCRRDLLSAQHDAYTRALDEKWSSIFHTATGPMWDKLIPGQSTSSTSFAHALGEWGVRLLGMETASVMPGTAMRIAFTRGAAP